MRIAPLALLVLTVAVSGVAAAQQVGDADAGIRVYKEFGACWDCHGWSGLGGLPHVGGDNDGMDVGPPLVSAKLDRAAMIEMVSCGRPDGHHPPFAVGAWTAARKCYGKTAAELADALAPAAPPNRLTEGQIVNVVAWVIDALQGKSMTKANCLRYFGVAQSIVCDVFP